jgi:hypothetical protein
MDIGVAIVDAAPLPSPDEELAALIVHRLAEAGLIDSGRIDEMTQQIASGTARADDWRLWIELALERRAAGDTDG